VARHADQIANGSADPKIESQLADKLSCVMPTLKALLQVRHVHCNGVDSLQHYCHCSIAAMKH